MTPSSTTPSTERLRAAIIQAELVADSPLVRLLQQCGDVEICYLLSIDDIIPMTTELRQIDVLLLSVQSLVQEIIDFVRRIGTKSFAPPILVVSPCSDVSTALPLLAAGATGYLLQDDEPAAIVAAIRLVASRVTCISASIAPRITAMLGTQMWNEQMLEEAGGLAREIDKPRPLPRQLGLTRRENEVLQQLLAGKTNQEIATALAISKGRVQNYVSSIYQKIGVSSRVELIFWGIQHRLQYTS